MREWILSRKLVSLALAALAVIAIALTAGILIHGQLAASQGEATSVDEPLGRPTVTSTNAERPTLTPTATAAPDATPLPESPPQGEPAAPQPAPAPQSYDLPGVVDMNPGPHVSCGENPTGQTTYLSFSWGARDGNTVDLYYAYTDGDYQATSGFILYGSGLATSGTAQIPRPCPNGPGPDPIITVKVVANNPAGSATAYYWGI